jgi:hypothetical protein
MHEIGADKPSATSDQQPHLKPLTSVRSVLKTLQHAWCLVEYF